MRPRCVRHILDHNGYTWERHLDFGSRKRFGAEDDIRGCFEMFPEDELPYAGKRFAVGDYVAIDEGYATYRAIGLDNNFIPEETGPCLIWVTPPHHHGPLWENHYTVCWLDYRGRFHSLNAVHERWIKPHSGWLSSNGTKEAYQLLSSILKGEIEVNGSAWYEIENLGRPFPGACPITPLLDEDKIGGKMISPTPSILFRPKSIYCSDSD